MNLSNPMSVSMQGGHSVTFVMSNPMSVSILKQGTHCTGITGKIGKMAKENHCQQKYREFGNFAKTQGIWFAQVVISLILKIFRNLL